MMNRQPLAFELAGNSHPVRVREHARARRVRLKVLPPGRIEVVVPPGLGAMPILAMLREHEAWLRQTLEEAKRRARTDAVLPAQVDLAAFGESWQMEYCTSHRPGWSQIGSHRLKVSGPDEEVRGEVLRRWLMQSARERLVPALHQVSEEIELPFEKVTVRGQRTRWGSCSARRHISLNYRLLFLPPRLVRYLFIHELCHTIHLNHSERYWSLVGSIEPEYHRLDRELRRAAPLVPAWAAGKGW